MSIVSELRRRNVATPELIAHYKAVLPPKLVKIQLAENDDSNTRSFFTVVLECDWDDEHSVRANFRDMKFVDLDHV